MPSLRAFKQAGAQINLVKMQVSKAMDQRPVLPIGKPGFNKEPLRVRSNGSGHFWGLQTNFWQDQAYEASAYQNVSGISKGTYTLSAYVMSGGEFDTNQLYQNYGGAELNTAVVKQVNGQNYNQRHSNYNRCL